MRSKQAGKSSKGIVSNPARFAGALAQVVTNEGGSELILGQAWLVDSDRLATCGHVVDQYVQRPQALFIRFPASNNRYPVEQIKLHPSFVRQPDGLVRFDAAIIAVKLMPPETQTMPLPFCYERPLKQNQEIWAFRYPAHLGQLSSAQEPLSQDGNFLGLLRKHDSFHLLHDLPLSPGDSGAPICDEHAVVALHCGDTATLPGLNLPTTSIRLALWVDALRDLNLRETAPGTGAQKGSDIALPSLLTLLLTAIAAASVVFFALPVHNKAAQELAKPPIMPVGFRLNKEPHSYHLGNPIEIWLEPTNHSPCLAFLFLSNPAGQLVQFFPKYGEEPYISDDKKLTQAGGEQLAAHSERMKFHLLACDPKDPAARHFANHLIGDKEWINPDTGFVKIKVDTLESRIGEFAKAHPGTVLYHVFDAPVAIENDGGKGSK